MDVIGESGTEIMAVGKPQIQETAIGTVSFWVLRPGVWLQARAQE